MHDAFDARWAATHPHHAADSGSGGGGGDRRQQHTLVAGDYYVPYTSPEARAAFASFARKYVVIKATDAMELMHEANRCKCGTCARLMSAVGASLRASVAMRCCRRGRAR